MLSKMGWKGDGCGLGKNQQGTSTHLRAVRRSESLGIGAENDAFGDKGWNDTNAGFHGVLASLKKQYSGVADSDEDEDEDAKKKRKKEEKKRKKKEEKRRAKRSNGDSGTSSGADGANRVRLPQNKVQAGHARKMREAKDIRNKSSADMAAIFGVKADFYKQPREWVEGGGSKDNGKQDGADSEKKKKKSKKKSKESDEIENDGKKDKKKRKRSSEGSDSSDDCKKRKKDKSKK